MHLPISNARRRIIRHAILMIASQAGGRLTITIASGIVDDSMKIRAVYGWRYICRYAVSVLLGIAVYDIALHRIHHICVIA